jgi:DoxX-like protein
MRVSTARTIDHDAEAVRPQTEGTSRGRATRVGVILWTVQGLLALLFLFTGGMKLMLPIAMLTKQMPMPGLFLRFIGLAEFAGSLGLLLPGLLRIRPTLTPLAAGGLVIIMSGAVGATLATGAVVPAVGPLVLGLLAGFVAYGRTRLAPIAAPRLPLTITS